MTNIQLPNNHITITAGNDIADICQPLFASSGIKHFVYGKVFDDGTCYFLSKNVHFIKDYLSKGYRVTAPAPKEHLSKKFNYLVSKQGDHSQAMQDAITNFNVDNIINFVNWHPGFYELFCLGSDVNNDSIINYYLNNLDYLDNFFDYFKSSANSMIKEAEKTKLVVPNDMKSLFTSADIYKNNRDEIYQNLSCKGDRDAIDQQFKMHYMKKRIEDGLRVSDLSKRETECLFHTINGKSAREIGEIIYLSPRTIEFHMTNLKNKFNCIKKSELISKVLQVM